MTVEDAAGSLAISACLPEHAALLDSILSATPDHM